MPQFKSLQIFLVCCVCALGLALGVVPTPSFAQTSANNQMDLLDSDHLLKIGDRLMFYVIEEREPPQVIFVNDQGYVKVPLAGYVPALGRTARELAYDVKNLLEVDFYHQATVQVRRQFAENSRGEITVLGEVGSPGKYSIPADDVLNVSNAVLLAGGFGPGADTDKVTVVRKDSENPDAELKFIVDVGGILATGQFEFDMPVEADDLIVIPQMQQMNAQVYVTGEVKGPGLYPIPGDVPFTVSRAILAAGGFTEWAVRDKVKLIRSAPGLSQNERTVVVNVRDILERNIRDFDPIVQPDDVIKVEEAILNLR